MTQQAHTAAKSIQQQKPNFKPTTAFILGSGLGAFVDQLDDATTLAYEQIPGFHDCTVEGHQGALHLGMINQKPVACLSGRPHYYEGVGHDSFLTLIRSLRLLGCEQLIATNASGSLREEVLPGEIVLVNDHINLHQRNPLIGANDAAFGPRFIGMEDLYDLNLRQQFHSIAEKQHITLHEGVYCSVIGPMFETPAEIRAYKILGADLIGMSTIPEVIAAHHCGMKVAILAAITNLASGLSAEKLSHEVTLKGASLATEKLFTLLNHFMA